MIRDRNTGEFLADAGVHRPKELALGKKREEPFLKGPNEKRLRPHFLRNARQCLRAYVRHHYFLRTIFAWSGMPAAFRAFLESIGFSLCLKQPPAVILPRPGAIRLSGCRVSIAKMNDVHENVSQSHCSGALFGVRFSFCSFLGFGRLEPVYLAMGACRRPDSGVPGRFSSRCILQNDAGRVFSSGSCGFRLFFAPFAGQIEAAAFI